MAQAPDFGVFGVHEPVGPGLAQGCTQFAAEADQVRSREVFQAREIGLHIYDGVEIPPIRHVYGQVAQGTVRNCNPFGRQEGGHIGKGHPFYLFTLAAVADLHQAGRGFQAHFPFDFGNDEPFLDADGDGADGTVPAHGQAAAGLNKEDAQVVGRVRRWIENAPAHHVVPAGLEHEALADPVVLGQEVEPFLAHVAPLQRGAALGDHPDGVAGRMAVDAGKGVPCHKSFQGFNACAI